MAMKAPALEFIKLWPSVFLEADLPGYEAPTQRLIALAERHPGDGVFAIDDPGVHWLKSQVAHGVAAYLRETGNMSAPQWGARARFESQDFGDYRGLANQPGADLAGMYVLRWPSQQSGAISFYDPRSTVNMLPLADAAASRPEYTLRPDPGTLLLWHSSLNHLVHPNGSEQTRISISFNIVLEWANHYASDV